MQILAPPPHTPTAIATVPSAQMGPRAPSLTVVDWLLRLLAACALAAALGGCERAPDVPTFDPPPPGAPVPKTGASQPANPG